MYSIDYDTCKQWSAQYTNRTVHSSEHTQVTKTGVGSGLHNTPTEQYTAVNIHKSLRQGWATPDTWAISCLQLQLIWANEHCYYRANEHCYYRANKHCYYRVNEHCYYRANNHCYYRANEHCYYRANEHCYYRQISNENNIPQLSPYTKEGQSCQVR